MDEELFIGNKSWNRMSQALKQEGFREGAESGKEETLQHGFNRGFKEGFSNNVSLGELSGIVKVLTFNKVQGSEHLLEWDPSIPKECVLCKDPETESSDISKIVEKQSELNQSVLKSKLPDTVFEVFKQSPVSSALNLEKSKVKD